MAFTFGTLLWIVLVGFLMSSGSVRAAQTVVANYSNGILLTVDLVTGNRTEITLSTAISHPVAMAVEADGSLLVGGEGTKIYRINPLTGVVVVVSDSADSSQGPTFSQIYGLAVESDGKILAVNSNAGQVIRVDPVTGFRVNLGAAAGNRQRFGIVLDSDGSIVTTRGRLSEITRMDRVTGSETTLTSGGSLTEPTGIVRASDGKYYVANSYDGNIVSVDATTGAQVVVSSSTIGSGPTISKAFALSLRSDGLLNVADFYGSALVLLNPQTGARSIISSATVGTGTGLDSPLGMLPSELVSGPSVSSTAAVGATLASATSIDFTVTFSAAVTGVDTTDFTLTSTGSAAGTISAVSGSGTSYTVSVTGVSGNGTLRLDLKSSGTGIQDTAATPVAITGGFTSGTAFTVDHNPVLAATPTSASITAASAVLGGEVTSDSNFTITERGVVVAKTSDNANPAISATGVTKIPGTGTTGVFTVNATGLILNTGYSFKAYAINAAGTTYSSVGTFTTLNNTAPVATDVADSTNEDTAKEITLDASDADGNTLTYFIVLDPATGTLGTIAGNKVTFTPAANANGVVTFTFKANDGTVDSATKTVTVTVNAVNDAPTLTTPTAIALIDTAIDDSF